MTRPLAALVADALRLSPEEREALRARLAQKTGCADENAPSENSTAGPADALPGGTPGGGGADSPIGRSVEVPSEKFFQDSAQAPLHSSQHPYEEFFEARAQPPAIDRGTRRRAPGIAKNYDPFDERD